MTHVAITLGGRYLRVSASQGETRLRANGVEPDPAGTFERIDLGHDRIALRSLDGRYLTWLPDRGQNYGLYLAEDLCPAAAFEEVLWPDDRVSLRSCALTYVGVAPGGAVIANRTEPGPDERFYYVLVAASLLAGGARDRMPAPRRPDHDARQRGRSTRG